MATPKAEALFEKYGVLTRRELRARVDVNLERYNRTVEIEARTLVSMLRREVLPAALRFQTELGHAVSASEGAGVKCADTRARLKEVVGLVRELGQAIHRVEQLERQPFEDAMARAQHTCQKLLPAMAEARRISDTLEQLIPDDLWPLPRYSEMLFVK